MTVACIDTHILIWGIERTATAGQEDMIERVQALFTQLAREQAQVIVPSIVFGEFLIGIAESEQPRIRDIIMRRFVVVPYDAIASIQFARIWRQKRDAKVLDALKESGATRTTLRADAMIVATALAANATRFYGHDNDIRKLAEGFIEFDDIADRPFQRTIFPDPS